MLVRITRNEGYESPKVKAAPGEVIDVNATLAGKLIACGFAIAAPEPVIETTSAAPPVNAAKRVGKPQTKARRSSRPAKEEAE